MNYIINRNEKITVEVRSDRSGPVLQKAAVNAYSKAFRKIKVKGGRK